MHIGNAFFLLVLFIIFRYPITILDMDVEEREVLCHYENSQSSDEWVCVDSCRIRPITVKPAVKPEFQINQKVMATWNDNRKFPAVVKTIFPDGKLIISLYV